MSKEVKTATLSSEVKNGAEIVRARGREMARKTSLYPEGNDKHP